MNDMLKYPMSENNVDLCFRYENIVLRSSLNAASVSIFVADVKATRTDSGYKSKPFNKTCLFNTKTYETYRGGLCD